VNAALLSVRVKELPNIEVVDGDLAELKKMTDAIHIKLDNGERIHTQLLVGADGAQSRTRTLAKFPRMFAEYGEMGVVASVRASDVPHETATAFQRFLPSGPLALLPVRLYCTVLYILFMGY